MSKSISKDIIRGNTEMIILSILNQGDSYGYQVSKTVHSLSDGQYDLNEATLYTVFRRLEKNQAIESYWGDETKGSRRKYYKITDEGRQQLDANLIEWEYSKKIIDMIIKGRI
ncbi:PadR family transcriptional regulator [Companilactobacillus sp. RD055328]|uniref:PadR family transcriptional regulator n=1 Tax=Companilactobacillus sp. RD055328 TaxID=2916634 RepID=UPI001FC7F202|nr:PadR family transcriptional regulator [Companilactobacillus sp. RD055328]GKQ42630.1 PadR family transcriptional regulator [Companilactobacillus sp. RD055328]